LFHLAAFITVLISSAKFGTFLQYRKGLTLKRQKDFPKVVWEIPLHIVEADKRSVFACVQAALHLQEQEADQGKRKRETE